MKKFFLTATTGILLMACNNGNDKTTTTSTTTDTSVEMGAEPATSEHTMDTAASSGKSMMSLMHANMDQMKAFPSTGNPDNDYAGLMKIHHLGAIEMAQLELQKGTDPEVKAMARKMLDAQQQEVAVLNTFLSGHSAHGGGEAFYKSVMADMNNMKMEMDHSASIDKQFIQMMIPHHQGAIDMSNAYLKSGAHEAKLKTMANQVIADQKKEIGEMQAWLKAH